MHRVHQEIKEYLLQLGSIPKDRRQLLGQIELDFYPESLELPAQELDRLPNNLSKLNKVAPRIFVSSHVPDAGNDFRGAPRIGDNPGRKCARFIDVRSFPIEPSQARLPVDRDRGQWLIDLVG